MASLAHSRARKARAGHNPLAAPLLVFAAVAAIAAAYVAYVLWPRWPEPPAALDAPSLPIVVGGTYFNIEPAAVRVAIERRAGAQDRVDLAYRWPSLTPPDPGLKPTVGEPVDPNARLFVTIQIADGTLPLSERVNEIYPRYLVPEPKAGPEGLTLRGFRDDTPYRGEELVFAQDNPEHFLARCSRKGVVNAGSCLLERRVGNADITYRFPREWLADWKAVVDGIDRLQKRLHPNS